MARTVPLSLRIHATIVRNITYIFSLLDRFCSAPYPPRPDLKLRIASSKSPPGSSARPIELLFYYPASSSGRGKDAPPQPAVINFHGGGWTFGVPEMDARWAGRVTAAGAIFVSVGYRLGPVYSFPVPIEDCEDGARWVCTHAAEQGIDPARVVISGFSAGGNMAFSVAMRLARDRPPGLHLASVLSFYPLLDRSRSVEQKYAQNPGASEHRTVPKGWQDLFQQSYLPRGDDYDFTSSDLSPGLADDKSLLGELPDHIGIWTCQWDYLVAEGEEFRARLAKLGKTTSGSMIEEVPHAWDRVPTYGKGNPKMDTMYDEAIKSMEKVLGSIPNSQNDATPQ